MRIGYACMTLGVPNTSMKTCMLKNTSEERLTELIANNLDALDNIIDYNINNNIKLFRVSSDLIPFGSNPANTIRWWEIFENHFKSIRNKINNSKMRISMHPGQYTVLNSMDESIVARALDDLVYHSKVLDCLGAGAENKIVLHVGGMYNNKNDAICRFVNNFNKLDERVKDRIVIENDEKSYNISDVLDIGINMSIPVVFDNLHNDINPSHHKMSSIFWINECKKTWKSKDGIQKIHYSEQNINKKPGSHANSINAKQFNNFYKNLERDDIDIMLEVKDKNISAIKCINCISKYINKSELEIEWERYKYKIMEISKTSYLKICKLLEDINCSAIDFYSLIEKTLSMNSDTEDILYAAFHIWEHIKDEAVWEEKIKFIKYTDALKNGKLTSKAIKNYLMKLAMKYESTELLTSYYFVL